MILLASSPLITTFGMVRCEVCSAAASAVLVRPGVSGNGLEAGCIGIGRVARHIIHEVAFGACLTRQPEALLSTADLRRLHAARRCPYHRRDDEANH